MNRKPVLAPIDGTLITKSNFTPDGLQYQMCKRCVMDTTDPLIKFDRNGQCSHCDRFDNHVIPNWQTGKEGEKFLQLMIDRVKQEGKGKPYDCIVGLSGGVDSSYLAVKLKEWGLRPLAVHVDAGWNSELAVKNIEEICKRLSIELFTHVVDWESMRDMQLAFLKSNLANQDVPQDHVFFAALYQYAIKSKIKFVMEGRNFATESILPAAWGYNAMDSMHVRSIQKKFGELKKSNFPIVSFFDLHIKYPRILGMTKLAPLNHIEYNKSLAIKELEENYGWTYYGGKHFESRWTRFFQSYYLPHKFGYDKRKAHLSSLILSGDITRDEALKELQKPLYEQVMLLEDKNFVAKKLRISTEILDELIKEPVSHYTDFGHNEDRLKKITKFYRTFIKPFKFW